MLVHRHGAAGSGRRPRRGRLDDEARNTRGTARRPTSRGPLAVMTDPFPLDTPRPSSRQRPESTVLEPVTRPNGRKVFIKSFGCQMNAYDAGRMADVLAPEGF